MSIWPVWLTIQVLLAAAYGLHRALGRGLSPGLRLRFARYATLAAFALPLALFAVPSRQLPRLHLGEIRTPIESALRARVRRAHAPRRQAVRAGELAPVPSAPDWRDDLAFALEWLGRVLLLVLLLGALRRAAIFARDLARLRRLLGTSLLLRRIGRCAIVAHDGIQVPLSFLAWRHAWIALPEALALRPEDLRLAVRHELQHHRTRDTAWAYWHELALAASWVNPFAHAWKREIDELQEIACDAALLAQSRVSRRGYADCLLRVAQAALETRAAVFAGTTNMAAGSGNPARFHSFLGRRIEMLTKNPRRGSRALAWLTGTVISLALLTTAYGSQQWFQGPPNSEESFAGGVATVDPGVQAIAEQSLEAAVEKHKARGGFVIVEEPLTGRVLAVANLDRSTLFHPRSPHWVIGERLEPASIAKGLVASEALELGRVTPDEVLTCDDHGVYVYHGKTYRDWKREGFGQLTVTDTIAKSSNLCGIHIGETLGATGLDRMLRDFGFGPGGVAEHFPEARAGLLPPPDESESSQYVPVVSTGYSLFVSPLEVVNAYSAIATGGVLMQPVPASDKGGIERHRVLSTSTAAEMSAILRRVVTDGTAKGRAQSALYTTAGKTASMYAPDHAGAAEQGLVGSMNAAGFVGFAPVSHPRVAVYTAIFDPTDVDGAHGAYHAAPLFREVVDRVLQSWQVPPDLKQ